MFTHPRGAPCHYYVIVGAVKDVQNAMPYYEQFRQAVEGRKRAKCGAREREQRGRLGGIEGNRLHRRQWPAEATTRSYACETSSEGKKMVT